MKDKKCSRCKETKPISEYYQKNGTAYAPCKECRRSYGRIQAKKYYQNNLDKCRKKRTKYAKSDRGMSMSRQNTLRMSEKFKEKFKARNALSWMLKSGKIKRGKCFCGKLGEAHHEDYKKPFKVIWLCPKHHRELEGRIYA